MRGGTLAVGVDKALRDAQWLPLESLGTLLMYPPIGRDLLGLCREDGTGPVRVLGNTWRPYGGYGSTGTRHARSATSLR